MSKPEIKYPATNASPLRQTEPNAAVLRNAKSLESTPFDYILVGAGPGGGPLAARLALAGKKVLLIDAGKDPAFARNSPAFPDSEPGEAHDLPGYHGSSTEDEEQAWMFSVRHYQSDETQSQDLKYNWRNQDPNAQPGEVRPLDPKYLDGQGPVDADGVKIKKRKQGIFYPRSSGLGGCTGHHAMIMVAPNDKDWNYIAELTGDDSWEAPRMQSYFTKLEACHYLDNYEGQFFRFLFGKLSALFWKAYRAVFDRRTSNSGHGFHGWQPTDFIDHQIVTGIVDNDRRFAETLFKTAIRVLYSRNYFKRFVENIGRKFRVVEAIDFNDQETRREAPEGVFLIPTGARTDAGADEVNNPQKGRRYGVREFILKTQSEHPDNLVLLTGAHVTRVIFHQSVPKDGKKEAPVAVGVEVLIGDHLYEASPLQQKPEQKKVSFFTRGEVILCGGAFNTPQVLMLSGIGEKQQLEDFEITGLRDEAGTEVGGVVNLPGVGRNLQDRYEVSVVSELKEELQTLQTLSFKPGDPNDQARLSWLKSRDGLYAGNGGTLAILRRSCTTPDDKPDLFIFGVPASFWGYYWNWSRELFKRPISTRRNDEHIGGGDCRKLWSWVILKAYTDNNGGTVRLVSNNPFHMPEICFHSFAEGKTPGWERDVAALCDAVTYIRSVNACNHQFAWEIQPGEGRISTPNEKSLEQWVQTQAWGHHACGTCRIGSDSWQSDATALRDTGAVLDSHFRVHGVRNLRVVDASVFPKIPGYFILAPLMMVSEKAADTVLQDSAYYPKELAQKEASLIQARRDIADKKRDKQAETLGALPPNTVALAFSGGGIRSATVCLGVIQALAKKGRLIKFDILSTVSGGGYLGGFLGRAFTQVKPEEDPAKTVQDQIADETSPQNEWLRENQNYIAGRGASDGAINLAILWRNITSTALVWCLYLLAVFGLLRLLGQGLTQLGMWIERHIPLMGTRPQPALLPALQKIDWHWSPWWIAVPLFFFGAVLPLSLGFWLIPRLYSRAAQPLWVTVGWLVLMAGAVTGLLISGATLSAGVSLLVLLLAFIWQFLLSIGHTNPDDPLRGDIIRNKVTNSTGNALISLIYLIIFVLIDSVAQSLAENTGFYLAWIVGALVTFMPGIKAAVEAVLRLEKYSFYNIIFGPLITPLALLVTGLLLIVIDSLAHTAYDRAELLGVWMTLVCLIFSLAIGRAMPFINLSSLHSSYTARLIRTYLGATNPSRIFKGRSPGKMSIAVTVPGDDIPWSEYKPHEKGGPLHLVNVCLNETIDPITGRVNRERKGQAMCLGPAGVSVGAHYHALWTNPSARRLTFWERMEDLGNATTHGPDTALRPIIPQGGYGGFHPLVYGPGLKSGHYPSPVSVEPLTLGQWLGISGAAFTTGLGQRTSLGLALLLGLVNLRLGYWWNSGINSDDRPWVSIGGADNLEDGPLQAFFTLQKMFLREFTARFGGPSVRYWYLSDGGHFEVLACYEPIRRRVPFIVCVDAGEDPDYEFSDLALLTRLVRIDFGADIEFLKPDRTGSAADWNLFDLLVQGQVIPTDVPNWIRDWMDPNRIGSLEEINRPGNNRENRYHAALARVRYKDGAQAWLLLVKSSLTGDESNDVIKYAKDNPAFPNDLTYDQIFSEEQWESYRRMGQHIGDKVFTRA